MIKFPMTVRTQKHKIFRSVDFFYQRCFRKVSNWFNVADFNMLIVPTYLARKIALFGYGSGVLIKVSLSVVADSCVANSFKSCFIAIVTKPSYFSFCMKRLFTLVAYPESVSNSKLDSSTGVRVFRRATLIAKLFVGDPTKFLFFGRQNGLAALEA